MILIIETCKTLFPRKPYHRLAMNGVRSDLATCDGDRVIEHRLKLDGDVIGFGWGVLIGDG